MTPDEPLQTMQSMIEAQDWQAYLQVRRSYIANGGKQSAIAKMIRSLPDEIQIPYGRYFKTYRELSTHIRDLLVQEDSLKFANQQAERQAAYEQRISPKPVGKPIKRGEDGQKSE